MGKECSRSGTLFRFISPIYVHVISMVNKKMCIFDKNVHIMRTNIEIDEALLAEAMKVTGTKTKKATVEEGLRLIVQLHQQRKIRDLRGKLNWEGNLEKMRLDQ